MHQFHEEIAELDAGVDLALDLLVSHSRSCVCVLAGCIQPQS